ncbi:MAG TPA: hypothetical protein VF893_07285 [Candidatus Bathyarchaeia archaeon]
MMIDKSIFGLRFRSNADLQPTQEELSDFLESMKKDGRREPHSNDLTIYRELLKDVQAFENHQLQDRARQDFQGKMFYGVLSHSRFVNPVLKSSVEEYKYFLRALIELDFKKPVVFIRSAEKEISTLNPKNQDHAIRLARLREMVDARKEKLLALKRQSAALAEELSNIALYIRDNLVKIEKLCETSIVVLVDFQIKRKEENQLIEEIKTHFKEHLKDSLHHGPITKQYLETIKHDVAILSKEISDIVREDVYALTGLYEAIHDHVKKISDEIDTLMTKIKSKKSISFEDDRELLAQVEQALVSLISDCHFELKATEFRTETAHEDILLEKRKEMLDHLFELLHKERRSRSNRRTGEDRRKSNDPNYDGPERRSGKDRRSKINRRKSLNLSS